jgi:hypothetical protein
MEVTDRRNSLLLDKSLMVWVLPLEPRSSWIGRSLRIKLATQKLARGAEIKGC